MNKRILILLFLFSFCFADDLTSIDKVAKKYQRPFTCLLIVKNPDFFLPLVKKYPSSTFVFLHPDPPFFKHFQPNIIYLQKTGNANALFHLLECEHFDLIYINSHEQFFPIDQYKRTIKAMGEHVFLSFAAETDPSFSCFSQIRLNIVQRTGHLYYFHQPITYLKRTNWFQPSTSENSVRQIDSSFAHKILYKNYGEKPCSSTWLPGINLLTFKMLNGVIPKKEQLQREINRLYQIPHRDWMPNNMIIQGNHLELIDFNDPNLYDTYRAIKTPALLQLVHDLVQETDSSLIEELLNGIIEFAKDQIYEKDE